MDSVWSSITILVVKIGLAMMCLKQKRSALRLVCPKVQKLDLLAPLKPASFISGASMFQ